MRQQLPDMEFGRRMAVERELEKVDGIRLTNIIFDETGHFVLYGTMLGIKVINVETNRYDYTLNHPLLDYREKIQCFKILFFNFT